MPSTEIEHVIRQTALAVLAEQAADAHFVPPVRRRWVDARTAASYCNLSEVTMATMRSKGRGPEFRRIGSRVLYRIDELDSYIDSHPGRPAPEAATS